MTSSRGNREQRANVHGRFRVPPLVGSLSFRPVRPEDMPFLSEVYTSTRLDELTVTGWSAEQIRVFLHMQFNAQHLHYQKYYPEASFAVILREHLPIGRLYVARWPKEIRLIDLALLPAHRNLGIGTRILKELLAEAAATEKPVRIHVEKLNRALTLYQRLGFRHIADKGVYLLLEWVEPY